MQATPGTKTGTHIGSSNVMASGKFTVQVAMRRDPSWSRAATDLHGSKRQALILLLACLILFHPAVCKADTDPVEEILATRPTADPKAIEYVAELIKTHSTHPKILELRYYRTGQLMGSSQDPDHFRSIIEDLEQLAHDAGIESELAFRCKARSGEIYYHCLRDKQAAYMEYKSIEEHPSLAGHALDTDRRRVELYVHIAESAFATKKRQEVENYTRIVMAYPYLGMEDRVMYQRFYDLYDRAGRLFIMAFSDNYAKLISVEIYPSHPELYKLRAQLIARDIGAEEVMRQLLSPEEVEKSVEPIQADMDRDNTGKVDTSGTPAVTQAASSRPHSDGANEGIAGNVGDHESSILAKNASWIIGFGIIAVVGVITMVYIVRRRKTT